VEVDSIWYDRRAIPQQKILGSQKQICHGRKKLLKFIRENCHVKARLQSGRLQNGSEKSCIAI
jgi:hypothetical protein